MSSFACFVRRSKVQDGIPLNKQKIRPHVSRLAELIVESKAEIEALEAEIATLEVSLEEKLAILSELPDSESDRSEVDAAEVLLEEVEEEEEEGGGLVEEEVQLDLDTKQYLDTRVGDVEYQARQEEWQAEFLRVIKASVQLKMFTLSKIAFGRKRKSKPTKVILTLSEDEAMLCWGANKKKPQFRCAVGDIRLLVGHQSDLFKLGTKQRPWKCFTLSSPGPKGGIVDSNFWCPSDELFLQLVTVIEGLCGEGRSQLNRARVHWQRSLLRHEFNAHKLSFLAGGMLEASEDEDGSVGASVYDEMSSMGGEEARIADVETMDAVKEEDEEEGKEEEKGKASDVGEQQVAVLLEPEQEPQQAEEPEQAEEPNQQEEPQQAEEPQHHQLEETVEMVEPTPQPTAEREGAEAANETENPEVADSEGVDIPESSGVGDGGGEENGQRSQEAKDAREEEGHVLGNEASSEVSSAVSSPRSNE